MEEKTFKIGKYLIHLLKCVLTEESPTEKPADITFLELFRLAKFHSVESMVYYGVEKLELRPDIQLDEEWRKRRNQNIIKSFTQIAERDKILDCFIKEKINVLPLKGCLLKEMYPQSDYRQMADLDILIESSRTEDAKKLMEKNGYITKHFNVSNHDNYEKLPYMEIELHKDMIPDSLETHSYYKNVWDRAVICKEKPGCYYFTWDDYYIFMLIHFAKHYYSGGSGIRSIMDIHVFLDQHSHDISQEYLKKELILIGLYEFKETAELLSRCWFGNAAFTKEAEEMAEYVITSGVYGTYQRRVNNQIKKAEDKANSVWKGKVFYFFSRLFLPYKTMCSMFPILKKLPILLPICWAVRLLLSAIHKRDRIQMELHGLMSDTKKEE